MSEAFTAEDVGTCTAPPATACPDDAGFLRQLIVNLTAQYNVNPNQVYVAGFSSGAQMTHRVGVEISDLVAAIDHWIGHDCRSTGASADYSCRALRLRLSRCRSGTARKILKSLPATTAKRNTRATISTWPPWTSLSITGPQQNACTSFENNTPLCDNGLANADTTGNDATGCTNNTEVQFIWEERVGHTFESQNDTTRWLFFAAHPKQPQ
jgi:poly(3-hydroxybutyrate) depolymerase